MVIATGFHLFPFRTEKLSPTAPMVLHTRGRVGRRHFTRQASRLERDSGLCFNQMRYCGVSRDECTPVRRRRDNENRFTYTQKTIADEHAYCHPSCFLVGDPAFGDLESGRTSHSLDPWYYIGYSYCRHCGLSHSTTGDHDSEFLVVFPFRRDVGRRTNVAISFV